MVDHHFSRVLITGTTSGLGRAFHRYYASKGAQVIEVNRRALEHEEELPVLHSEVLDITNAGEVFTFLMRLQRDRILPDLFILNAGVNLLDNSGTFDYQNFSKVMNINLTGAMTFVSGIHRLGLKGRTVATISSASNIVPNPSNLSYHLSKLNLKIATQLLQKQDKQNYYKTIVLGPVHTNIQDNSPVPTGLAGLLFKFLAVQPDKAAGACAKFFEGRGTVFHFTKLSLVTYWMAKAVLNLFPFLYPQSRKFPSPRILSQT